MKAKSIFLQKVVLKWSKIGSRKVRIVTLKATFRASFFGIPKNPCFKVPVDSSMRDTFIYPSQKSQNLRTNIERTNIERKLELSHYERKGASRKNMKVHCSASGYCRTQTVNLTPKQCTGMSIAFEYGLDTSGQSSKEFVVNRTGFI